MTALLKIGTQIVVCSFRLQQPLTHIADQTNPVC